MVFAKEGLEFFVGGDGILEHAEGAAGSEVFVDLLEEMGAFGFRDGGKGDTGDDGGEGGGVGFKKGGDVLLIDIDVWKLSF